MIALEIIIPMWDLCHCLFGIYDRSEGADPD